jgi:hypothetical protein
MECGVNEEPVVLALALRNVLALEHRFRSASDPSGSGYLDYLAADQLAELVTPSAEAVGGLRRWLRGMEGVRSSRLLVGGGYLQVCVAQGLLDGGAGRRLGGGYGDEPNITVGGLGCSRHLPFGMHAAVDFAMRPALRHRHRQRHRRRLADERNRGRGAHTDHIHAHTHTLTHTDDAHTDDTHTNDAGAQTQRALQASLAAKHCRAQQVASLAVLPGPGPDDFKREFGIRDEGARPSPKLGSQVAVTLAA